MDTSLFSALIAAIVVLITALFPQLVHRFTRKRREKEFGPRRSRQPIPVYVSCQAPSACPPGHEALINVILHLPGIDLATPDDVTTFLRKAVLELRDGTRLLAKITCPEGLGADATEVKFRWTPPVTNVEFLLRVDVSETRRTVYVTVELFSTGTHPELKCRIYIPLVIDPAVERPGVPFTLPSSRLPRSAFASYARIERAAVMERVSALEGIGVDVFVDCLDIREGEGWEEEIARNLDSREVLLLFWSRAASDSQWVEQEWRYVLTHRGLDVIRPNALEPPDLCPPPDELSSLQFGSHLLFADWRRQGT